MNHVEAKPIPWSYADQPGLLVWTWISDHFVARVNGQEVQANSGQRTIRSYRWELLDKMRMHQGMPRILIGGEALSFEQAESQIAEHVAKCYDPRLGYRSYSGCLAFTFELSSGERMDVSSLIGSYVNVELLKGSRQIENIQGDLSVHGYAWRLDNNGQISEISPEHVLSVTNRASQAKAAQVSLHGEKYSGVGRIYREDARPGCTGKPGYLAHTVDHAGAPQCQLHEVGLPAHLVH